jgi:hypothetical protein
MRFPANRLACTGIKGKSRIVAGSVRHTTRSHPTKHVCEINRRITKPQQKRTEDMMNLIPPVTPVTAGNRRRREQAQGAQIRMGRARNPEPLDRTLSLFQIQNVLSFTRCGHYIPANSRCPMGPHVILLVLQQLSNTLE